MTGAKAMTATDPDALTMHPVVESVMIARVKDGEVVESELLVGFTPAHEHGPALLAIAEGWKKKAQTFGSFASYEVLYGDRSADLRTFTLVRDEEAVERARKKNADESDHYTVGIGPSPAADSCDCWGAAATERIQHSCKHKAACRALVDLGHL
jgi:hypothetical protein